MNNGGSQLMDLLPGKYRKVRFLMSEISKTETSTRFGSDQP